MPDSVRTFLANNAVGLVGIAIPAALAIYFYLRSRRAKVPCWAVSTVRLVTDRVSGLQDIQIRYKDQAIQQLSVSRVTFYNKGAETIRREDIPRTAPLRIVAADGVRILDASLVATNNPTNAMTVAFEAPSNLAVVSFDYLDRSNGCVVEVIHTGSGPKDIRLEGTIIGAEKLRLVIFGTNRFRLVFDRLFVLLLLAALLIALLGGQIIGRNFSLGLQITGRSFSLGILVGFVAGAVLAYLTPGESAPKGLERFSSYVRQNGD